MWILLSATIFHLNACWTSRPKLHVIIFHSKIGQPPRRACFLSSPPFPHASCLPPVVDPKSYCTSLKCTERCGEDVKESSYDWEGDYRNTRRRRDGVKQSPCLPFPVDSTRRMVDYRCLTWFHWFTMDAPGKVRFNSPLSRRPSPDHRPRKGAGPDEGSCRVFPGKTPHHPWPLQISAQLGGVRGQWQSRRLGRPRRQSVKGVPRKATAKSKDHVVFSPGFLRGSVSRRKTFHTLTHCPCRWPYVPLRQEPTSVAFFVLKWPDFVRGYKGIMSQQSRCLVFVTVKRGLLMPFSVLYSPLLLRRYYLVIIAATKVASHVKVPPVWVYDSHSTIRENHTRFFLQVLSDNERSRSTRGRNPDFLVKSS